MAENGSNGTTVAPASEEMLTEEQPSTVSAAKELAAATMAEASKLANEKGDTNAAFNEPAAKKARITDEQVEEKDFDKETQKALEEIDANQNEIDALNERKFGNHSCYMVDVPVLRVFELYLMFNSN